MSDNFILEIIVILFSSPKLLMNLGMGCRGSFNDLVFERMKRLWKH